MLLLKKGLDILIMRNYNEHQGSQEFQKQKGKRERDREKETETDES